METDTAAIPWTQQEFAWAQCRPAKDRTPIPEVGDEVMFRHTAWGVPVLAEVLAVQSLDDISDPNLWRPELGPDGQLVTLEGRHILSGAKDPWPELTLRTPYGVGVTREARLRGSAGWLPLDWESRTRPAPAFTIIPRV